MWFMFIVQGYIRCYRFIDKVAKKVVTLTVENETVVRIKQGIRTILSMVKTVV